MLLQYVIDPRHEEVHQTAWPITQRHVSILSKNLTFSELVTRHLECIMGNKHTKTQGSTTGLMFEMVLIDALAQKGVSDKLLYGQTRYEAANAELDIVTNRHITGHTLAPYAVGLMLKTSMRERWKQADRDALIFKHDQNAWQTCCFTKAMQGVPLNMWLLSFREKPSQTAQQAVDHMQRLSLKMQGIDRDRCISVYDVTGMNRLLQECLNV